MGETVTMRAKNYRQPHGGFIPVSAMQVETFPVDGKPAKVITTKDENISPSLMGKSVDYLTRLLVTKSAQSAFEISLIGARNLGQEIFDQAILEVKELQKLISEKNLNHGQIKKMLILTIELTNYDTAYRAGPSFYRPVRQKPDLVTLEHLWEMGKRTQAFLFKLHEEDPQAPLICDFDFKGAYTDTIINGDGDFIDGNCLVDLKTSMYKPKSQFTLQILIYYVMGLHCDNSQVFKDLERLGLFYPRQNHFYFVKTDEISHATVEKVEKDVVGY